MLRQKKDRIIQSPFDRKIHRKKMHADTGIITNEAVTQAISGALQRSFGWVPSSVKYVASRIKRNPRAVRNWFEGQNAPRAAELIDLMRESDEVYEEVLRLANRKSSGPSGSDIHLRIKKAVEILEGENVKNEVDIN